MSPIRTYLDTNVLIGAATGTQVTSQAALSVINDRNRIFVSSIFSRMETLPFPTRKGKTDERDYYITFYTEIVKEWARNLDAIINSAITLSGGTNIDIMDACHLMAAVSLSVDEFITAEIPSSPLVRYNGIRVKTIYTPPPSKTTQT